MSSSLTLFFAVLVCLCALVSATQTGRKYGYKKYITRPAYDDCDDSSSASSDSHSEQCPGGYGRMTAKFNIPKTIRGYYQYKPMGGNGVYHSNSQKAIHTIKLEMSKVAISEMKDKFGVCFKDGKAPEFEYHMHTQWNFDGPFSSRTQKFDSCTDMTLGGHYDVSKTCSPHSQYAKDSTICPTTMSPEAYKNQCTGNDSVFGCQVGDYSGKFGNLVLEKYSKGGYLYAKHMDSNAPLRCMKDQNGWDGKAEKWSIAIHLVCEEKKNPIVFCSRLF